MRSAVVFNFLLEANLMASAAIVLMIAFRKFLRKPLGNRMIYFLWLLIAIRLICPIALNNPWINEFRPGMVNDQAIRPIAGQIKVRLDDIFSDLRRLTRGKYRFHSLSGREEFLWTGCISAPCPNCYCVSICGRQLRWCCSL